MLRMFGGCMILAGSVSLGLWYSDSFTERVKALRLLATVLTMLQSEIRYGRGTLPECCGHIAGRFCGAVSDALRKVAEGMGQEDRGESFGYVFRECMAPALEQMPLRQEDREEFFRFAGENGCADGILQVGLLEQSRELLEKRADRLAGENEKKCRMAVGLGVTGGLLLILVLW